MYIERDFDCAELSVFTSNKTPVALYFPGFRFRCTMRWERLVFISRSGGRGGGGRGGSHMKGAGMLVVSLMGVNFGFWSHLGCS